MQAEKNLKINLSGPMAGGTLAGGALSPRPSPRDVPSHKKQVLRPSPRGDMRTTTLSPRPSPRGDLRPSPRAQTYSPRPSPRQQEMLDEKAKWDSTRNQDLDPKKRPKSPMPSPRFKYEEDPYHVQTHARENKDRFVKNRNEPYKAPWLSWSMSLPMGKNFKKTAPENGKNGGRRDRGTGSSAPEGACTHNKPQCAGWYADENDGRCFACGRECFGAFPVPTPAHNISSAMGKFFLLLYIVGGIAALVMTTMTFDTLDQEKDAKLEVLAMFQLKQQKVKNPTLAQISASKQKINNQLRGEGFCLGSQPACYSRHKGTCDKAMGCQWTLWKRRLEESGGAVVTVETDQAGGDEAGVWSGIVYP